MRTKANFYRFIPINLAIFVLVQIVGLFMGKYAFLLDDQVCLSPLLLVCWSLSVLSKVRIFDFELNNLVIPKGVKHVQL